jgi:hypothetical protein
LCLSVQFYFEQIEIFELERTYPFSDIIPESSNYSKGIIKWKIFVDQISLAQRILAVNIFEHRQESFSDSFWKLSGEMKVRFLFDHNIKNSFLPPQLPTQILYHAFRRRHPYRLLD